MISWGTEYHTPCRMPKLFSRPGLFPGNNQRLLGTDLSTNEATNSYSKGLWGWVRRGNFKNLLLKSLSLRRICTPMFTAALFTVAKTCKQPKCPSIDDWIRKMWHMHSKEYYSTIKRRKSSHLQQHRRIWEYEAEWKKSDKKRQILYELTYMWNTKMPNS